MLRCQCPSVCLSVCLWRLCTVVTWCDGSRISLHAVLKLYYSTGSSLNICNDSVMRFRSFSRKRNINTLVTVTVQLDRWMSLLLTDNAWPTCLDHLLRGRWEEYCIAWGYGWCGLRILVSGDPVSVGHVTVLHTVLAEAGDLEICELHAQSIVYIVAVVESV